MTEDLHHIRDGEWFILFFFLSPIAGEMLSSCMQASVHISVRHTVVSNTCNTARFYACTFSMVQWYALAY